MKIHRLTHVGFVTPDIEAAVARWGELFNLGRSVSRPNWYAAEEGIHASMMMVTGAGIEPLQPATGGTAYAEALAAGRGAYHLSFRCDDIERVAAQLWEQGLWVQLRPPGKVIQMHRLWIDPLSGCGATIEFIDRAERHVMMNTATPEGDAPVIDGPWVQRMSAVTHIVDDLAAARHLYHDIFGFACAEPVDLPEEGVRMLRFTVGDGRFGGGEGGPAVEAVEITDPHMPLGQIKRDLGCGMAAWTLEVPDLAEAHDRLRRLECWMRVQPDTGRLPRRIWVHPRSACGVALLLVQAAR